LLNRVNKNRNHDSYTRLCSNARLSLTRCNIVILRAKNQHPMSTVHRLSLHATGDHFKRFVFTHCRYLIQLQQAGTQHTHHMSTTTTTNTTTRPLLQLLHSTINTARDDNMCSRITRFWCLILQSVNNNNNDKYYYKACTTTTTEYY